MTTVDHYMVDFEDEKGAVQFASDVPLTSLPAAKALARKVSKKHSSAYVVAYVARGGQFEAVGHVSFFLGRQGGVEGLVA